jgi:uncharacterized coiled-coil protein SlyX
MPRSAIIRPNMPDEISSGGDYPQSSNVETRVSAIEMRLARVETAVDGIQKELQAIRIDLAEMRAEMRGRLTNIPTTFQIAFMLATFTVATFIGATGSALAY